MHTITGKLKGTIEATTPTGNLSSRQFTPLDTAINRPLYAAEEGNPIAHYCQLLLYGYLECFHALCDTSFCLDDILSMLFDYHVCEDIEIFRHQMMKLHQFQYPCFDVCFTPYFKGFLRCLDSEIDVVGIGEDDGCEGCAIVRICDGKGSVGRSCGEGAANEVCEDLRRIGFVW